MEKSLLYGLLPFSFFLFSCFLSLMAGNLKMVYCLCDTVVQFKSNYMCKCMILSMFKITVAGRVAPEPNILQIHKNFASHSYKSHGSDCCWETQIEDDESGTQA